MAGTDGSIAAGEPEPQGSELGLMLGFGLRVTSAGHDEEEREHGP